MLVIYYINGIHIQICVSKQCRHSAMISMISWYGILVRVTASDFCKAWSQPNHGQWEGAAQSVRTSGEALSSPVDVGMHGISEWSKNRFFRNWNDTIDNRKRYFWRFLDIFRLNWICLHHDWFERLPASYDWKPDFIPFSGKPCRIA